MELILLLLLIALMAVAIALLLTLPTRLRRPVADLEPILRELRLSREEAAGAARQLREEVAGGQKSSAAAVATTIEALGTLQKEQLNGVMLQINEMKAANEQRLEAVRSTVDRQLNNLQESNDKKLDKMRETVDEKLQSTLETRLGESFKQVSERLEAVHRGLGEMQNLATGVGDLKRVLTNVKTRGTWGEVQLHAILEQILTPDQYASNVQTREGSGERVEYAIKLPGPDDGIDSTVWLPIDAKFPQEDYQRLVDASESADVEATRDAYKALLRSVENSAREIHDKYINPPRTTDFAIMFLPTEGLYAEVLRQPGFMEKMQHDYRINIAGPHTLSAILNSLRMGFRTLAIEQRSSEVWQILAAVKTEFGKYGDILRKVKTHLQHAQSSIDQTETRTNVMRRKLREVEELPAGAAEGMLGLENGFTDLAEDEEDLLIT